MNNLLPNNGKIVIIDDKFEQALPILQSLAKNNIPSVYQSPELEKLPENPYKDIRLLFLDINLHNSNEVKDIVSFMVSLLPKIISPNTPYILAIWSVKDEYTNEILNLFNNQLCSIKPLIDISLNKLEFFEQDNDDPFKYIWKGDILALYGRIVDRINEKFDAFKAIIHWENLVNDSVAEIIQTVMSLTGTEIKDNEKLKNIYYKLAEAMYGKNVSGSNNVDIITKTITVLNELLLSTLEHNSNNNDRIPNIENITKPATFSTEQCAIFNSSLLISINENQDFTPGCVYKDNKVDQTKLFNDIIGSSINIIEIAKDFYLENNNTIETDISSIMGYRSSNRSKYGKFEKSIRKSIIDNAKCVFIELSPSCDYAQKKWKRHRICPGILCSIDNKKYISDGDSVYISPSIFFDDKCYSIVLDFRFFSSICVDFKPSECLFKLKHSFLVDIQSQLSRHINRPGITYLQA